MVGELTVTAPGRILKAHMNDQAQWNKLYEYLDKRFGEVGERIERVEERLSGVESTVDALYKERETEDTEQAAMKSQLDRHDRWHHQAADKLGLQLDH